MMPNAHKCAKSFYGKSKTSLGYGGDEMKKFFFLGILFNLSILWYLSIA